MIEKKEQFNKAKVHYKGEDIEVKAKYFVGAEGRSSLMRKAMNKHVITTQYNHQFLTVMSKECYDHWRCRPCRTSNGRHGYELAIQDAGVLGELFVWIFKEQRFEPHYLKYYEKVRKKRSDRLSRLSHMSAMALYVAF